MDKLTTIDLFAGAGGLSHGFLSTNKFDIKLAIEYDKNAQETYRNNHPNVTIEGDINVVDFHNLKQYYKNIDIIIGGPPCQGFSNANRQRNYLVSPTNQLIKKYVEAVEVLNPNIIVMENVKTIASDKHKFIYSNNDENIIEKLGIELHEDIILIGLATIKPEEFLVFLQHNLNNNLVNYIFPEVVVTFLKQLLKKCDTVENLKKYIKKNQCKLVRIIENWDFDKQKFWSSDYKNICVNLKDIIINNKCVEKINTLKRLLHIIEMTNQAFKKAVDINDYDLDFKDMRLENDSIYIRVNTYNIVDFIKRKFENMGFEIIDEILNSADYGVPQLRERYILIGIKKNLLKRKLEMPKPITSKDNYITISDAITDLEEFEAVLNLSDYQPIDRAIPDSFTNDFLKYAIDSNVIYNHISTATTETALKRFKVLKPGQNFHDLTEELKTTYTTPSKTQNTIYKRLVPNKPSDTVVNVRKSMWIHPTLDRAISIREAARLQSFPDSFIFYGKKDAQYQQIGNAVPPLLGKAIADQILKSIKL